MAGLAGAAAAAAVASAACLDLTPLTYEAAPRDANVPTMDVVEPMESAPPPGGDASVDVLPNDADAAVMPEAPPPPPTCLGCINLPDDAGKPGCASDVAACLKNPECSGTYLCAVRDNCFQQPSFKDIVACGLPCAEEAGIMSTNDPAVQLIENIAICAACRCDEICSIGDSGISCDDI